MADNRRNVEAPRGIARALEEIKLWRRILKASRNDSATIRRPREELVVQMRSACASLPPQMRLVLELRYGFDGHRPHSYRKIAQVLGVRPKDIEQAQRYIHLALMGEPSSEWIDLGLDALRIPSRAELGLADVVATAEKLTPELIEHLRQQKDDISKVRWDVFEHLVGEFLTQQGFRDVRLVGRDPRTSADLYATWVIDATGIVLRFFIEVKRWEHRVGITVINEVLGAMLIERETFGWHAGLIIATGGFAKTKKYSPIELSLRGIELKEKNDLLQWLDGYRPNKNGLWLPAPEKSLPERASQR